jgi:hypothetical protein
MAVVKVAVGAGGSSPPTAVGTLKPPPSPQEISAIDAKGRRG